MPLCLAIYRQTHISMTNNNNQVPVIYIDAGLRNLVEEYITQQKSEFTLKGVCSYVLYWAVEDGKAADGKSLVVSPELSSGDQERIRIILDAIIADGRVTTSIINTFRILIA